MKLLVWNIQQGGGSRRRQRIIDCITNYGPDIVALIESERNAATTFMQQFRDVRFEHQICTTAVGSNYPICVLSKRPISTRPCRIPPLDGSGLWLEITVPAHRFSFGVVHVPTSPRTNMKAFLDALVQIASLNAADPFLFVGDFNTGIGPADGPLKNFGDVDRFVELQKTGFTDVWRYIHGDKIEHTWCRA